MVGTKVRTRLVGFLSLATLVFFGGLYQSGIRRQRSETEAFLDSIPVNLSRLPTIDGETCRCHRQPAASFHNSTFRLRSSCSKDASARGPRQWVVSFSLYGTLTDFYGVGVRRNAQQVALLYPGWVMRVYHSLDTGDDGQRQELCALWCQFPHVDFCPVGKLPAEANLPDVWKCNGMIWRFLVLGDPSIERFVVRDLDSSISEREIAAVSDWIASNRTWHFMHDNPVHNVPILGGMWGGINRNLQLNTGIRDSLIYGGKNHHAKGSDQTLLAKYLFPLATRSNDYIDHNSYLCNLFAKSHPFPTRRSAGNDFVGSVILENATTITLTTCPEECRPPEHLDWIYC